MVALQLAALGLFLGVAVRVRWRLPTKDDLDLTPSLPWPEPTVVFDPDPEEGPVLVTVEYRIAPADASAFLDAMQELGHVRRRNGAYRWGIFQDTADGRRFLETYVVASWVGHLREHERISVADEEIQERAQSFHAGDDPPVVSHYLGAVDS